MSDPPGVPFPAAGAPTRLSPLSGVLFLSFWCFSRGSCPSFPTPRACPTSSSASFDTFPFLWGSLYGITELFRLEKTSKVFFKTSG